MFCKLINYKYQTAQTEPNERDLCIITAALKSIRYWTND